MKKIPTLFKRDPEDRAHVLSEVTPGCEWVLSGEGVATRKYDGTCVLISIRGPHARREVKPDKRKPPGFVEVDFDPETGKTFGWEPIEQSPFAKQFAEAYTREAEWKLGTYELCGPKINGNPEGFPTHMLIRHADAELVMGMRGSLSFDFLSNVVPRLAYEGVVWHHPDGRMAKLKARDFASEQQEMP